MLGGISVLGFSEFIAQSCGDINKFRALGKSGYLIGIKSYHLYLLECIKSDGCLMFSNSIQSFEMYLKSNSISIKNYLGKNRDERDAVDRDYLKEVFALLDSLQVHKNNLVPVGNAPKQVVFDVKESENDIEIVVEKSKDGTKRVCITF